MKDVTVAGKSLGTVEKAARLKKKASGRRGSTNAPKKYDVWVESGAGSLVGSGTQGHFDEQEAAFSRIKERVSAGRR